MLFLADRTVPWKPNVRVSTTIGKITGKSKVAIDIVACQ